MTDDEDAKKLIKKMCDEKYQFICYTMAEIIRKKYTNFPSFPDVPFVAYCPKPLDISSTKYNSKDFKNVVKDIKESDQAEIKKVNVHQIKDALKISRQIAGTSVLLIISAFLTYIAGLGLLASAAIYAGVFGGAQATDFKTFTIGDNYMPVIYNHYVKQYGLVIYEEKTARLDKIYFLDDMLSSNDDMRPKFQIKPGDLQEMIKNISKIRNRELEKLKGTDDKTHCLQGMDGVYPIYGVGTFTSQDKYVDDEYYKGMYLMFVAGVYNFFEIMKYVLVKKYKNQYCAKDEPRYYEAMIRMKIQIIDICERAFGT